MTKSSHTAQARNAPGFGAPVRGMDIPARELRNGDLLHVGGTNYVLVHSVEITGGRVAVTSYNGDVPNENGPFFIGNASKMVNLSMRDAKP